MFSIQRFDGSSGSDPSKRWKPDDAQDRLDRIALLNRRKAQEQQQQQQQQQPITPLSDGVTKAPSAGLSIHPSRLAASHVLRQSDKKARSSANGTAKEKTRAKQRYLNRKKERRKKKKAAVVASTPKAKHTGQTKDVSDGDEEEEGSSDDDTEEQEQMEVEEEGKGEDRHQKQAQDRDEKMQQDDGATISRESSDRMEDLDGPIKMTQIADKPASELTPATTDPTPTTVAEPDALARFPAPRTTSQATTRDLAAQGLPQGLAHPQRVDAAQRAAVSKGDHCALDLVSDATRARLSALGITRWFAVQTAMIPKLLDHSAAYDLYPSPPPGDLCVSAPTGSGKTLSYVVPIVEVLQRRIERRLRALILLPTRDLVHQVRETLEAVAKGTGLTMASVTGQQSFAHEQATLVDADPILLRRNVPGLLQPTPGSSEERELMEARRKLLAGGKSAHRPIESKVDIVIATPGRLIDHMEQTPGFTLQHLRFLVIDEADRLLHQSFQEWLPRILEAIDPVRSVAQAAKARQTGLDLTPAAMHPAWLQASRLQGLKTPGVAPLLPLQPTNSVQKLLFSATLTRDPAKIVALDLREATFISVEDAKPEEEEEEEHQQRQEPDLPAAHPSTAPQDKDWQDSFALPATLQEHMVVMPTADKPLALLYLLYLRPDPLRQVLCFTKSVENAKRLVTLLSLVGEARHAAGAKAVVVGEYSSDLRGAQRSHLLTQFKAGTVDVLVCSDVIARGIDLPDVRNVISYDAPIDMAKYVHRVGRTARAGRTGDAFTLVEEQEARHFTAMMRRAGRWTTMHRLRLPKVWQASMAKVQGTADQEQEGVATQIDPQMMQLVKHYRTALRRLEQHYSQRRTA